MTTDRESRRFIPRAVLLVICTSQLVTTAAESQVLLNKASSALTLRTYIPSTEEFPNPERGFAKAGWSTEAAAVAEGLTLVHVYFRLDEYRSRPLPRDLLEKIEQRFVSAQKAGVKLIPRFTYNFPAGLPLTAKDDDAPLPMVLSHIEQLKPVLNRNADLLAYLEAGFIGAWGEWHHSTRGLEDLSAKKAIVSRLLKALPTSRMVTLRYARHKQAIFGRTIPLTTDEGFSGRDIARVGHHNDCFLASENDWDTYRPSDPASIKAQKEYLSQENRFLPQGGETCNDAKDAQPFIGCENALAELQALRWTQMKIDYHPGVLAGWRKQGCFPEIARRLGYRLRLTAAALPAAVRRGHALHGYIELRNDGFASLYNPRPVELVLRERGSRAESRLTLKADPRRWAGGDSVRVPLSEPLPLRLKPGTYDLFLNLPDASPRLRNRPRYSVRLANIGIWEASTGYNALGAIDVRR